MDTVDPFYIYKINDHKWNVNGTYYIQQGYLEVAKEFVEACTDKDIVSESRRESYNELLGFDQHSVHVVSIVKNKMDTVDPFYIYKINDHKWNVNGTYATWILMSVESQSSFSNKLD